MTFMLNGCFRLSRSFILIVLLFCSFSEAAFAARRSGPITTLSVFASIVGSFVYIFGDTTQAYQLPDHSNINPKLYLKYDLRKVKVSDPEVYSESEKIDTGWELDDQHRMLEGTMQKKQPDALILPVQLKAVPATPEVFATRNNNKSLTENVIRAGTPDDWNAYLYYELFWRLHPFYVELGRDSEKMHPYYRPILSACLDFTGENRFPVRGILSDCVKAASSRLKRSSTSDTGIYAIGEPGAERLQSYVASNKKIRLPVYSVFDGVAKIDWELFYVVPGADGDFELISAK